MADRPVMVVTGGSRGIGAAVVRAAASRYDIVLSYAEQSAAAEQVAALAESEGARVTCVRADVATEDGTAALFDAVDAAGGVDVLVNNAGIAGAYGTLDVVDEAMLARLWAVNITGPFLCAREAARRMRTDRGGAGGSIVNISSKAAVLGGTDEWVHYAASKGALDTMTTGLAKELAPFGVRVNGVRPGLIESDFHLHAPPGRVERMAPQIPMLRSGSAEEVAGAVLWLCSSDASYVTGAFIDVTGGR
ncbi:MAG TPA: NAD(P)-dependent oxidoreductase [Acidimicrobiaceae bacterium]|nr:NAD(P)-dependent oxidoreductase [Acidimicrobiaceae bacterium]